MQQSSSMRIEKRNVFWSISIIVIILLLWQITLIIITMKEDLNGVDFNSFDINLNTNISTIPRIIHQMWKTKNLLTYPINNSHSEWKKLYPDYKIRLWTDEDLNELLSTKEYKYLDKIYKSYPYSIQRADLGRLIILHKEGGIYADLDVFPCSREVEKLRLSNMSFIIPRSSTGTSLINHFLVAQKSSKIVDLILHKVLSPKYYKRIYILPYLEVFSTGSIFLSRIMRDYIQTSNNNKDALWILSENEVTNYVTHYTGRSWHSFDGYILNLIDRKPKLFTFILSLFITFILFGFKYRNNINKFIKFR